MTNKEALEWIAQMHMNKEECKEQIKEDILAYFDSVAFVHSDHGRDDLCQIVEDNFKKLEN
tara:strand:+ start:1238 stop:1420 length:183 start_codon:yes stop_codon:yes gene_type:complete